MLYNVIKPILPRKALAKMYVLKGDDTCAFLKGERKHALFLYTQKYMCENAIFAAHCAIFECIATLYMVFALRVCRH